jgi:hypothetical protein
MCCLCHLDAHCEQRAQQCGDPRSCTRLRGHRLRYSHKEGIYCGSTNRSVTTLEIETDFGRLIKLLTIRADALGLMTELAIQADKLGKAEDADDLEARKREGIALCNRRTEATIHLYSDGVISREGYLRRVDQHKREIAYWEARTTETEKAALELAMCTDAIDKLARLWDTGDDEDKQGMARSLFSYLVYDLDARRIVDFRLKPWAERFLVLRSALYDNENGGRLAKAGTPGDTEPASPDMAPEGYGTVSRRRVPGIALRQQTALHFPT